jgi:ABC-type glycerol-3-phosphate transport system substrate-binding protein
MTVQFEWQVDEERPEPEQPRRRPSWSLVTLFGLILLSLLGVGLLVRRALDQADTALRQEVQELLDLEQQAVARGDGELFLSLQEVRPAWIAAQLQPANQAPIRAGMQVARVEATGDNLRAHVQWREGDQLWQRIIFLRRENGRLRRAANTNAEYWGRWRQRQYGWGNLAFYDADDQWTGAVATFVEEIIDRECPCPGASLPLTLTLADDFGATAVTSTIRLPSPRLLALDQAGQPAPLFWQELNGRLSELLQPGAVRFAVPGETLAAYQELAREFARRNPGQMVEIVSLAALPASPQAWVQLVDGAAVTPDAHMLAAGHVHDLTDFAQANPAFSADFYPFILDAARWQERLWFVPQTVALKLIFYDIDSYRSAQWPAPSIVSWNWEQLALDMTDLPALLPGQPVDWVYFDDSFDTLYAYAYTHSKQRACPNQPAELCRFPAVQAVDVAAALAWYGRHAGQSGQMPDVTRLTPAERASLAINLKGLRRVIIWVEEPVNYELYVLRQPMGVIDFPRLDRSSGVTPLWVEGSFISQYSVRPLATWRWLNFLSQQRLARQLRHIPARRSVADADYWPTLPDALNLPMRAAFVNGRPVTVAEQALFSWEQLTAVISGEMEAMTAGQRAPRIIWFGKE